MTGATSTAVGSASSAVNAREFIASAGVVAFEARVGVLQIRHLDRIVEVRVDALGGAVLIVGDVKVPLTDAAANSLVREGLIVAVDAEYEAVQPTAALVGDQRLIRLVQDAMAGSMGTIQVMEHDLQSAPSGALVVGCFSFRRQSRIESLSARAFRSGHEFLPIVIDVDRHWIGPIFNGTNACPRCVSVRLRACSGRLSAIEEYWRFLEERPEGYSMPGVGDEELFLVAGLAASIALRGSKCEGGLGADLVELDRSSLEVTRRHVLRVPRCELCGQDR